MSTSRARILIVDSDPETAEAAAAAFRDADVRFTSVASAEEALEALHHHDFDAALCELHFGGDLEFAALEELQRSEPRLPVIGLGSSTDGRVAIEAVKNGAFDFVTRPIHAGDLVRAVREAINCSRKASEPVAIDPGSEVSEAADTLVGNSRAMLDVYKALGRLSPTPVTVLIRGETGTGKELVARALYQHGHRFHKPFITVNCAAIPENLIESELFGHERGAFTGATVTRIGKFEQANGATLFLDEIGDLDLALQAKLLRVLQEKRFQRVGGSEDIAVDVRIIAATHRPLERMIAESRFREDLFYRLNVATIKLPPLRDRAGDVALLAKFFLERFSRELEMPPPPLTKGAVSRLGSARLPGNVRQLQNVVRKALLRARGYPIDRDMIEELLVETEPPEARRDEADSIDGYCRQLVTDAVEGSLENVHQLAVERVEGSLIEAALHRSHGNISQAAKWLGISRLTLREKAKKYDVAPEKAERL